MGIFLGGVAIVWSFLSRRQQGVAIPQAKILAPDISRQSTKFEYTEHKRGRPVFRIYAETSTETVSKVHTLKDVSLTYFDESGKPSDTISGRNATYRIDDKQVEFSGDTRIQLADGTEVFSEQVSADLHQEIATIEQDFRFKRGNVQGNGKSLIYRFPQREIQVEGGLHVLGWSQARPTEATALQGTYHLSKRVVTLVSGALITSGDIHLKANQISLFLTEEHQIQRILSSGEAELQAAPLKSFSGHHINVFFDTGSQSLEYFEILGETQASFYDRASYSERVEGSNYLIEADRIVAVPEQVRETEELLLKRFTAQGDVRLKSITWGIQEARSAEMQGEFFEDGEHLRQLDLRGQVSVTRGAAPQGLGQEQLSSRTLTLQFEPDQVLKEAKAAGDVELILNLPEGQRRLVATEFVEVHYQEGLPERIVSKGDCQLESVGPGEKESLQAPLIEIRYRQGLLDNIIAQPGVKLESEHQGEASYTTSDRLEVVYHNGKIKEVVQSGNFHFWEGDAAGLDLRSDRALFDPTTQKIIATGEELSVLRTVSANSSAQGSVIETVAQRFELDRITNEVLAKGQIRSFLREEDTSTVITSGRMQADSQTGWVQYSVHPRIVQGANSIRGKIVRYNHQDHQLLVEGDVKSSLIQGDLENGRRYSIEAERLVYKRLQRRANYQGEVHLQTDDMLLVAPFMELVFESTDGDQLQEIVAWGGVQITEGNRRAEGSRVVHYPLEKKVVLTGSPAQVVEIQKGKAAGRQLTFYLGDEKLLIEGRSTPEKP